MRPAPPRAAGASAAKVGRRRSSTSAASNARVSGDEGAHAGRVEAHLAAEEGENVGDVSLEGLRGRRWMVVGVGAVVTSAAQRADEVRARRERLARASREQVGGAAHEHGDPLEHLGVLVVFVGGEGGERAGERARGDARATQARAPARRRREVGRMVRMRERMRAAAGRPARAPRHEPRERSRGEHRRHARGGGHPDNLRRPHRGAARALVRPRPTTSSSDDQRVKLIRCCWRDRPAMLVGRPSSVRP